VPVRWPELLDDIERRLADVERGLTTGALAVSPFALPQDLGPVPEHLRARAAEALRQTLALETEVESTRERVADSLRRARVVTRMPAAYLDTRI
jgi:hypothetical protein